MIAQTLSFLVLAAGAVSSGVVPNPSLENVDPNTLSCDAEGLIFLLLPHFTDCAKFYMCAHGKEVEFDCPSGTIFNFTLQVCDHIRDTECTLRTEIDIEGSGSGDDIIGIYGEETEIEPLAILSGESSGSVKQFNNVLNCDRADDASRQVPYKSDCQRYWKCIAGVPQIAYCSDGLFFNDKSQQCDFEANVRCAIDPVDELTGEFIIYE